MADDGDLTVTALYTSATWAWAGFGGAELFLTREAGAVFSVTNGVMGLAGLFRRGPSLKWSLAQRHAVIDHLVERSGATQIVELAAGLSRRGVTFSERPGVRYVEVDLPAMIRRKEELLARTSEGTAVLARPSLVRVGADVRELDLAPLIGDGPACVIAEGLLMYLDAEAQRRLWARVAEVLRGRGGVLLFDLVPAIEQPSPGWIGRALGWLMGRFTRGQGFVRDERSRTDIVGELRAAGFAEVRALEPGELAGEMTVPGLERRTQVVVFRCRC